MEYEKGRGSLTSRYLLALLAPAAITAVMQVTWPLFEHNPVSPYLLAIIFGAWYGGLGPGLVSVAISFLLTCFFFIKPYFFFWFQQADLVRLLLFAVVGSFISVMSELMHRERRRAAINLESAKCAEESLLEKERFLNQIAELSPVVINVFDLATRRNVYISPDVVNLLGYTPKEISEMDDPFSVLWHPEDLTRAREHLMRLRSAADGAISEFEYRVRHGDGEWRWLSSRGMPFARDEIGFVRQIVAATVDITDRKRADDGLRSQKEILQKIFDHSPAVINFFDADGRIQLVNREWERLRGCSLEEIQGQNLDLITEGYPDPEYRRDVIALAANSNGRPLHLKTTVRDGRVLDSIWSIVNLSDGTRIGLGQDITELKQVERAQRESQRQYETLVQSIDGIVWEADPKTFTFTFVSKQAERILGYPLEQWFEGPGFWPDHMHPDDRESAIAFCVDATARRVDHQFEYRMIAADGHVVWLSDVVTVHVVDDQPVLLRGVMLDITQRKHIEEKLRQSKSQMAEAQRLASVGSWNWDIRNNTHTWSDELYHIYGLDPHESSPSYETFIQLVHPDDRAGIGRVVDHALKTPEPIDSYLRIIRPDGIERIIHSRGNTISDTSGTPIRMHGTVQDVSERKQTEEALRKAEQKYRDIFENAGEGIFQSTPDGRYIAANPALARMYGFASPEELIHSRQDIPRQSYVDPTRREEFICQIEEQGAVRGFELEGFRKDGSKIWISVNARAVWDEQGAIQYYEGTGQDITDRKRAEEALRESEERYRDLVENSLDLICTHDLDGLILSANRATAEALGHNREDFLGKKNLREILTPKALEGFEDYLATIRNEGTASGIMQIQTNSGEHRIWEYRNTLRTEGVPAPIVRGMARDITDRNRAEEALRESEERYRELFENAKDAIYVQDLSGRYTSVNRAAEKLSGFDRQEVIGKHFDQFVAPDYLPLVCAKFSKKLVDREETAYEVEFIARDGRRVPVELSSALILKHGVPVGIQGIARDITERKRAADALRQQTEILQKIFDHIPVMIRLTGPDGETKLVNREYERTTGWSLAEIQKDPHKIFAELYPDKHERQGILDRIAAAKGEWADFKTHVRDGRVIDTSWANIRLSAGISLGIGQDVSQRKRAEETLRSYSRQLIEAQEAERQHIARELHDQIGQVLTALRINLETIGSSCETAESRSLIDQGVVLLDASLEQVRNLSFELRPSLLDDLGLVSALRWYSDQYMKRTGIRTKSVTNLAGGQIPFEART